MCDTARLQLIAWIDGELEGEDSLRVASHVAQCRDCAREVRRISALSREITEYCAASVPNERRRYWVAGAVAAAAVLLVTGLLWTRVQPKIDVVMKPPVQRSTVLVSSETSNRPLKRAKPVRAHPTVRPRPVPSEIAQGEPGVTVVIPLDQVLPVGAAPPGAVLIGNLTFDAGGQPSRIQLE